MLSEGSFDTEEQASWDWEDTGGLDSLWSFEWHLIDLCCDWKAALLRMFSAVKERCLVKLGLGDKLFRMPSLLW